MTEMIEVATSPIEVWMIYFRGLEPGSTERLVGSRRNECMESTERLVGSRRNECMESTERLVGSRRNECIS